MGFHVGTLWLSLRATTSCFFEVWSYKALLLDIHLEQPLQEQSQHPTSGFRRSSGGAVSATRARGLKRGRFSLDRGLRKLEVGSQKAARSLSKGFQCLCIEGAATFGNAHLSRVSSAKNIRHTSAHVSEARRDYRVTLQMSSCWQVFLNSKSI